VAVNTKNLTIEDILDMSDRERDRVAAEWIDETMPASNRCNEDVAFNMYHAQWQHAGRLLEALPVGFQREPQQWVWEKAIIESNQTITSELPIYPPLSKKSIVLAACICAVRGVEPRG
jgi:hypothetical protein